MGENPLAKYLPKQEDSKNNSLDLIERANQQFSCLDILNKEYGYNIPHGGQGSTKQYCIWGWEHRDIGVEKCMRYYWETDTAYCFRDHGVVDVVSIRATERGMSKTRTAKLLLQEAGVFNSDPWNVRIEKSKIRIQEHKKPDMDMRLAESMFNSELRSLEDYATLQYKPDIVQAKNSMLEELDPSWSAQQILDWISGSKAEMEKVIKTWQRKT